MKSIISFILLAASLSSAQSSTRKPTISSCRGNLKHWAATFKSTNTDANPFSESIRNLDLSALVDMPDDIEACRVIDKSHRYEYEWVLARVENVIVRRTAAFLISTDQVDRYAEWEDGQRRVTPVPNN